jgi:hypothetical protein
MTDVIVSNKRGVALARTRELGTADKLAKHYESIGCRVKITGPNCLVITGRLR